MSAIEAVVFDLGGVVLESPLEAIARYEREHGLPPNAINRAAVRAGDEGAWARLERGELTAATFCGPFESDSRACGIEVNAAELMTSIARASVPRPQMVEAVGAIRRRGSASAR